MGSSICLVHLINFIFARWFCDPRTFLHIPYQKNQSLVGTACYASMNALLDIRLTRRDDLESLAYVLIYFMHGLLPWQSMKSTTELLDMRIAITPSTLCKGLPAEFEIFLNYARSLEFKQKPDYQYLRGLFSYLLLKHRCDGNDGRVNPLIVSHKCNVTLLPILILQSLGHHHDHGNDALRSVIP